MRVGHIKQNHFTIRLIVQVPELVGLVNCFKLSSEMLMAGEVVL